MSQPMQSSVCRLLAVMVLAVAAPSRAEGPDGVPPADADAPLELPIRRSTVIRPPWPVRRVSVADPEVADVRVLTPRQVMVLGKAVGSTDLLMWDDREQVVKRRVDVTIDHARLQEQLTDLLPGSKLQVRQSQDVLTVSGLLRRAEHADQLHRFLDAAALRYVDVTSLAGVQQVQIKVRVAEVSRNAVRALGFNTFVGGSDFFGGIAIGSDVGGALNPASIGVAAGASATGRIPFTFTDTVTVRPDITVFAGVPQSDLEFFLRALNENQYMRILAEPTLIARSGREASFLVGGEFPIPVVQGAGTSLSTSITIEYREFGVRLSFKPTVLGDGTIRLHVAPEVSELSDVGAVEIEGFRIPSLLSRKAQTELELASGQTFALAGLISRTATARNSRIPLFGDIPILGALFRSVRYQSAETELVILVTASLVEPLNRADTPPTPGDLETAPSDWELYFEGRLRGRAKSEPATYETAHLREMGLNDLSGPGAWARYGESRPAGAGDLAAAAPAGKGGLD